MTAYGTRWLTKGSPSQRLLIPSLFVSLLLSTAAPADQTYTTLGFRSLPLSTVTSAPLREKLTDWLDRSLNGKGSIQTSKHPKVVEWRHDLEKSQTPASLSFAAHVNRITNKHIKYIEDYRIHRKMDYWNTPHDTLVRGGDCEDIALLKAVALHFRGWPAEDMYLLVGYTRVKGKRIAHAVLVVDSGSRRYVLDNLSDRLVPYEEAQIEPVYALNLESAVMFYKPRPDEALY